MNSTPLESSNRRVLVSAIASLAASLIVGCATQGGGEPVPLSVHPPVSLNVVPANSPCPPTWTCWTTGGWTVQISEEPINTDKDSSPVEIHWIVIANGWTFDQNKGIDFRNNAVWKPKRVTDKEWKASNRKDGLIYKYAINLVSPTGVALPPWDPTVMN